MIVIGRSRSEEQSARKTERDIVENNFIDQFLETKSVEFEDYFQNISYEKGVSFQNSNIGIDLAYAYMHLFCQKIISDIASQNGRKLLLLDVGSQFSFISFAANFFNVVALEPRASSHNIFFPELFSIEFIRGEAQKIPAQDSVFDIVTSLHAIEHFGLGRYGDTYDYFGDQRGISELCRVLSPTGILITAVPASKRSEIEFNGQRKYNPEDFNKILLKKDIEIIGQFISYVPGTRHDGMAVGDLNSISDYNESFTPPVLITICRKKR